jgi:hypothetical protein
MIPNTKPDPPAASEDKTLVEAILRSTRMIALVNERRKLSLEMDTPPALKSSDSTISTTDQLMLSDTGLPTAVTAFNFSVVGVESCSTGEIRSSDNDTIIEPFITEDLRSGDGLRHSPRPESKQMSFDTDIYGAIPELCGQILDQKPSSV